MLSRLTFSHDPTLSLSYAQKAVSLGDSPSISLQTELLDRGTDSPDSLKRYTKARTLAVSQLLAKLDPSFSFNVSSSESLQQLGYINFIFSKFPHNLHFQYTIYV